MKPSTSPIFFSFILFLLVFTFHPVRAQYCVDNLYSYGCLSNYIDNVSVGSISQTNTGCIDDGYSDYTNLITDLEQGSTYTLQVTVGNYGEYLNLWIDYNDDYAFDSSELLISNFSCDVFFNSSADFYVSPSAILGEHRMRIRCVQYTIDFDACSTYSVGEVHDYTANILPSQCFADFTIYPDSLIPHHYWAVNLATGTPPLYYLWNWGDGTYDSTAYPSHTYDTAGYYTICLTIFDSTGCESMFCNSYDIQKLSEMNSIITVDVVDSIPDIATTIQNTKVLQSWSIYPNPASENVFVNYSLSIPARMNIELCDMLGNKLEQINSDEQEGEHHSTIDIKRLPNGIYFLQLKAGDQIVAQKIVVEK